MSKVISVTIPGPCVDDLQKAADKVGISRSRFISNVLLKWQTEQSLTKYVGSDYCIFREEEGTCKHEGSICDAPLSEAVTCEIFIANK